MAWSAENSQSGAAGGANPPAPDARKRYRCKIDTATAIRSEIAKLYRACRTGEMSVDHFSKLTNALYVLGRMVESSAIEDRIAALEAKQ